MYLESPVVSIIIPVFNVKPWLSESLDSVINQTYTNLEIILIDDGSTDGSGEICDDYRKRDDRIIVIHQEHKGLSAARNTGLEHASGDFIAFMDSDDVAYPRAITRAVTEVQKTASQIIAFGVESYNKPGKIVSAPKAGKYNRADVLRSLITKNGIAGAIWTKIFRSSALRDIRFPEGHNYVDIEVFLKAFDKCGSVAVIPDQLVRYRKRPGSITTSNTPETLLDGYDQNRWMYEYSIEHNANGELDDVIEKIEVRNFIGMLGSYSALFNDESQKAEILKEKFRDEILLKMKDVPNKHKEMKVWIAVQIFKASPMAFVILHKLSHSIRRK